jgi:phosphoribosylglycinamide formyltransferase 1
VGRIRVIGVLVSGNGTNLQALVDAGLPLVAVASSRKDAYALQRAREAGLPTATFSLDCHESREERDLVMATWLEEHGVELVVLAGYMQLLTPSFLDRFQERVVNVHP